jgi:hypothetical protein
MKQTQWVVALVVLAVMVFVITFAMNYLGGGATSTPVTEVLKPTNEVIFLDRVFPADRSHLVQEERSNGHYDYWLYNPNDQAVVLGVERTSCRCAGAELFVPDSRAIADLPVAFAAVLGATANPLPVAAVGLYGQILDNLSRDATRYELMTRNETGSVPAGGLGWIRLSWKGERTGKQNQFAKLWMDDRVSGKTATLEVFLNYLEPLRVRPTLDVGTIRDDDLRNGLTRHLICWSSTRDQLTLTVRPAVDRGGVLNDPFVLGKPEPLSARECQALERENNDPSAGEALAGPVRSAYRIPLTLQQVSPNGKNPFDVGPFRRRFLIGSPDVIGEQSIVVNGRVSGLVEIGLGDENAEINFFTFPRKRGKREKLFLQSDAPDIKLEFDRVRTPEYLEAKLVPETTNAGRQSWRLEVQVLPGKAFGVFPRRNDPAYEDAAVYLKALLPGKEPRAIRIPVSGTASES